MGKGRIRGGVIKVSANCCCMVLGKLGYVGTLEVKRKFEFSANSWNTVNDIGPINGAAVPGIGSGTSSGDKIGGVVAIILGDCKGLDKIMLKLFDAEGLVVALC